MKNSISHLPDNKQVELLSITKKIQSIAEKKNIPIDMIILFGSYARGDFVVKDIVMEGDNTLEYKSDFDILVITRKPAQEKNISLARDIGIILNKDYTITSPVSILVEDIHHVNARLEENRYFYLDIKREGILLYDSKRFHLKPARELSRKEALDIKKDDYEMWFGSANEFFIDYKNAYKRKSYKIAVFYLHQATERYITAYLLVKTGYKPKSHDLEVLYNNIYTLHTSFHNWFLEDEREYFELLRKAYVDARYSKNYSISQKQILFLEQKVITLQKIVEKLCKIEI